MNISIHIPEWLLWLIGVPFGLVILFFAGIGLWTLWCLRDFGW